MDDAMLLWDGMFAVDPSLEIALWICVAMLIRIRNQRAAFVHLLAQAHKLRSNTVGLQRATDLPASLLFKLSRGFYTFDSTSSRLTAPKASPDTSNVTHSCDRRIRRV